MGATRRGVRGQARSHGGYMDLTSVYIPIEYTRDSGPLYAAGVENGIDGENGNYNSRCSNRRIVMVFLYTRRICNSVDKKTLYF